MPTLKRLKKAYKTLGVTNARQDYVDTFLSIIVCESLEGDLLPEGASFWQEMHQDWIAGQSREIQSAVGDCTAKYVKETGSQNHDWMDPESYYCIPAVTYLGGRPRYVADSVDEGMNDLIDALIAEHKAMVDLKQAVETPKTKALEAAQAVTTSAVTERYQTTPLVNPRPLLKNTAPRKVGFSFG